MKAFPFQKRHRLTLKKEIEALFRQGKSFNSGPLRLVYMVNPNQATGLKVLITVPRKKFRKATDRNRIRRMIREAYRLNRMKCFPEEIISASGINMAFIYTGDDAAVEYKKLSHAVSECLRRLASELETAISG